MQQDLNKLFDQVWVKQSIDQYESLAKEINDISQKEDLEQIKELENKQIEIKNGWVEPLRLLIDEDKIVNWNLESYPVLNQDNSIWYFIKVDLNKIDDKLIEHEDILIYLLVFENNLYIIRPVTKEIKDLNQEGKFNYYTLKYQEQPNKPFHFKDLAQMIEVKELNNFDEKCNYIGKKFNINELDINSIKEFIVMITKI